MLRRESRRPDTERGEVGRGSRPGSPATLCPLPAAPALAPGLERSRSITTAWSDAASEAGAFQDPTQTR